MKKILLLIISFFLVNITAEARDIRDYGYSNKRIEGGYYYQPEKSSNKKRGDDNWSTFGDSNPTTTQPGAKIDRTYDPYKNLR